MSTAKNEAGIDRRSFLKGALATGAIAAAGAGLAGCAGGAKEAAGSQRSGSSDATNVATGDLYALDGCRIESEWLPAKPEVAESDIAETVSVDIVVVGAGHAGIAAAKGAAQKGASVAVIEAQSESSFHVLGQDFGHFNSQWLIDKGYGPYDTGAITHEFVVRSGNRVNPELIRTFVQHSGEAFDDMLSSVPADEPIISDEQVDIHVAYGRKPEEYPIELGGYKNWPGCVHFWGAYNAEPIDGIGALSTITEVWRYNIKDAEQLGATWYWEHEGVVLEQNDGGDITGVIAKNADGAYVRFEAARGVILATGDFSGDPVMLWDCLTELAEWNLRQGVTKQDYIDSAFSFSGRTGTGHKMGIWAGATLEPTPRAGASGQTGGGGPWGTAPFLWLNANGERYMNEADAFGSGMLTLRQPVGIVCTVTDSKWMQTVQAAGIDHGAPDYGRPQYYDDMEDDMNAVVAAGAEGAGVRSCTIAERNLSTVYGSESLEEALRFAGYDEAQVKVALGQIEHYNELCRAGCDADYGKDASCLLAIDEPPYYTSVAENTGKAGYGLVTWAGLMTDNDMNCVRVDGTPIKGLYAVGNVLGQRWGTQYNAVTAGVSIGMAATHGRLCGQQLAEL